MKSFSNTYIFVFSAVMVVIVAALLSSVFLKLKPVQDKNIKLEQMQNILASVNINSTEKDAGKKFNQYIVDKYVINDQGEKIPGIDVFSVNMKVEVSKIDKRKKLQEMLVEHAISPFKKFLGQFMHFSQVDKASINSQMTKIKSSRELPVYVCKKDGEEYYIFPVRGKGLWGPIWGYIALKNDFNTIYGANFDHKTETPGLGAEIKEKWFQDNFKGKKLFDDGKFVSIEVVKGGAPAGDLHGVNAISGATITSKGVQAMIRDCLSGYLTFFENQKKKM